MTSAYRFSRPEYLEIPSKPKLSVAVVIACRDGQAKLDLLLASLAAQNYPTRLMSAYIIDDGSENALTLPKIRPTKTKIITYKNSAGHWGKTAATNDITAKLTEDVLWFVDADMVFDPDHLSHHMKWHHQSDDYAVLGWKRFVDQWSYSPAELHQALKNGNFQTLHSQSWGKELWEDRVERTDFLQKPALDGYRAFVGATFSMRNSQWKRIGGYNRQLITGEDTELGWRVFTNGLRMVAEREAHSWHLGYSTVEQNKEIIHRHNDPALAQFIPQMHSIRARYTFDWKIPTYEVLVDVRNSTLAQILEMQKSLLELTGTSAHFNLLGPWKNLLTRYSPISDSLADLREIQNWLKGDKRFSFTEITDSAELTIDNLISHFTPSATPYYLFIDGDFALNLKDLSDHLLKSGHGFVGVANKNDRRAFAIFAPALARAINTGGWVYKNIADQFGIQWITEENFDQLNQGRHNRFLRFLRYLKREGKKINSPRQLVIFLKKILRLLMRKALRRG